MYSKQEFYICNESHVFIFDGLGDRVRVGVQWGYSNRQGSVPKFSYCCCGEADSSNLNVHGPSAECRPSIRKEVESAVLQYLGQNRIPTTTLVREYHNISLTDLKRVFHLSFYGLSGQPQLGFHMSGAYDCFGSPQLDIAQRNRLLAYAKKMCSLAGKRLDGSSTDLESAEFIKRLSIYN